MTAPVLGLGVLFGPIKQMVEDAALALLAGYTTIAGGYLESLGPYGGELDSEEGLDALVKQALGGAPLVLVGAQESTFSKGGLSKRAYREVVALDVVVASSSLRGLADRRRAGPDAGPQDDSYAIPTGDPGVYRILEDVRRTLLGAKAWIDGADAAEVLSESPFFTVPRLTLWRAQYRIGVAFELPAGGHLPATSIQARHNLDGATGANPIATTDST